MKLLGPAIALSSLLLISSASSAQAQVWHLHQFMDGAPIDLTLNNVRRPRVLIPQPPCTSAAFASLRANPWTGSAIHSGVLTHSRVLAPTIQRWPCAPYQPGFNVPGRYHNLGGTLLPYGRY